MLGVRPFFAIAALAVALGAVATSDGTVRPADAAGPVPSGYAYALVMSSNGNWIGPTASGEPDLRVFDALEAARPQFLRVSTHSGPRNPNVTPVPIPDSPEVLRRLEALRDSGTKLGVSVNAYWVHKTQRGESKTVAEVLREACDILEAANGLYEWIFLDFALSRTSRELRRLVRGLRTGTQCGGLAWAHVVTNSTNWKNRDAARLAPNAGAHGARLSLMNNGPEDSSDRWRERAKLAAAGRYPAIGPNDRSFVRRVRSTSPMSTPLLKLEVPHQTSNFASLTGRVQRSLIRRWAELRERLGYELIFPLFVHKRSTASGYDSRAEGTFELQRRLLRASVGQ